MSSLQNSHRQFASDNYAGICPEAFAALQEANVGHTQSYGEDPWTRKATQLIRDIFETDCEVFFVFNGTAANALTLESFCSPFHSILCHQFAHLETDECGAPSFFTHGSQTVPISGTNGKLHPKEVERIAKQRSDVHFSKPRVISVTQATELGTLYSSQELGALGKMAKKLGLYFHMDGARFANAVAGLKVAPKKITWKVGVDVLSFGGTKNGMALGEAVVFFNRELAKNFGFRRKQAGQLASKMRFISAQWVGLLKDGAWLRHAIHANHMAQKLERTLRSIPRVKILYPRQANSVFVDMSLSVLKRLHRCGWHFYTDVGPCGARLMCSWDTAEEDIDALTRTVREIVSS